MQLAVYNDYDGYAPDDVQEHRKHSIEAHRLHGQPVILKSKWTERDVEAGLAVHCPYDHDEALSQGRQWDKYCFGTGYLGGYADGIITFVTIVDASVQKVKLDREGALFLEETPQIIAPWQPKLGTGDLIITAHFSPNNWDVIEVGDRFELGDVTPTTLRGHGNYPQKFVTQQAAQATLLPHTHELYQVPIVFNYSPVDRPVPPTPAPGVDPTPQVVPGPYNITHVADEDVEVVLPEEVPEEI